MDTWIGEQPGLTSGMSERIFLLLTRMLGRMGYRFMTYDSRPALHQQGTLSVPRGDRSGVACVTVNLAAPLARPEKDTLEA